MNKQDLKEIMRIALKNGHIRPCNESSWGFDYTGKDEYLLSDGAFQYLGKPVLMFKFSGMITEVGTELAVEISH